MVSVHGPTEDKDEQVKEEFYQSLENLCDRIPKYDMKVILGILMLKLAMNRLHIQPVECMVFMI